MLRSLVDRPRPGRGPAAGLARRGGQPLPRRLQDVGHGARRLARPVGRGRVRRRWRSSCWWPSTPAAAGRRGRAGRARPGRACRGSGPACACGGARRARRPPGSPGSSATRSAPCWPCRRAAPRRRSRRRFAAAQRRSGPAVGRRDQVGSELVRSLGYGTGEVAAGVALLVVASAFRRGDLTRRRPRPVRRPTPPSSPSSPSGSAATCVYQRQADVSVDRLAELLPAPDRRARRRARPRPTCATARRRWRPPAARRRRDGRRLRRAAASRASPCATPARAGASTASTSSSAAASWSSSPARSASGKSTLLRALLGLVGADARHGPVERHRGRRPVAGARAAPGRVPAPGAAAVQRAAGRHDPARRAPATTSTHALWLTCLDEDLGARCPTAPARVIGPRGLRLSGGQIQRAGAARALVRRPELLVVDDLSSALDVETEARLWDRVADGGFAHGAAGQPPPARARPRRPGGRARRRPGRRGRLIVLRL